MPTSGTKERLAEGHKSDALSPASDGRRNNGSAKERVLDTARSVRDGERPRGVACLTGASNSCCDSNWHCYCGNRLWERWVRWNSGTRTVGKLPWEPKGHIFRVGDRE